MGPRGRYPVCMPSLPPRTRKWLGLGLLGLLALVFWDHIALWPLKVLVVFFHELGHALAALVTGGEVAAIELSSNQGGSTSTRGGNRFLILSAGYLGSLAFGVLWLFLGRTARSARVGVWVLSGVLAGGALWWVRPVDGFGFGFTLTASLVALVAARWTNGTAAQILLRTLGAFSVLYALWDIRDDVFERSITGSDASQLAEMTFIPAPVWGVFWLAVGVGTLVALRKWLV